ncbi:hypothetical protein DFP72DRAFT_1146469 [Ephemerocybe angulata]|uniref:Uncharacterized protein n=1 Tax=Ephemerocybe angulata TaxID=980116 RepID=A0A8H6HJM0_9AGAR|nr:hypothetical protein DFP72DRAFT_1146469 [Tulosesus angulatus]
MYVARLSLRTLLTNAPKKSTLSRSVVVSPSLRTQPNLTVLGTADQHPVSSDSTHPPFVTDTTDAQGTLGFHETTRPSCSPHGRISPKCRSPEEFLLCIRRSRHFNETLPCFNVTPSATSHTRDARLPVPSAISSASTLGLSRGNKIYRVFVNKGIFGDTGDPMIKLARRMKIYRVFAIPGESNSGYLIRQGHRSGPTSSPPGWPQQHQERPTTLRTASSLPGRISIVYSVMGYSAPGTRLHITAGRVPFNEYFRRNHLYLIPTLSIPKFAYSQPQRLSPLYLHHRVGFNRKKRVRSESHCPRAPSARRRKFCCTRARSGRLREPSRAHAARRL